MTWETGNRLGQFVATGEPIILNGLNPWQHDWIDANEPPLEVTHPLYPSQKHIMDVYKISIGSKTVKFAAGEFSNGAWGFYLPSPSPS